MKYVVMAVVLLHNICVYSNDPCKPRRKLSLNDIELIDTDQTRQNRNCQNKSMETAHKTSN